MTDEQKIVLADKIIARQEKQKAYDKWYLLKQKHYLAELQRVIKDNDLENEIKEFDKVVEDFI